MSHLVQLGLVIVFLGAWVGLLATVVSALEAWTTRRRSNVEAMAALSFEGALALAQMNRRWFVQHQHLTTDEMLAHGLIDPIDVSWVERLRQEHATEETQHP